MPLHLGDLFEPMVIKQDLHLTHYTLPVRFEHLPNQKVKKDS
jgi:hypothetical protein